MKNISKVYLVHESGSLNRKFIIITKDTFMYTIFILFNIYSLLINFNFIQKSRFRNCSAQWLFIPQEKSCACDVKYYIHCHNTCVYMAHIKTQLWVFQIYINTLRLFSSKRERDCIHRMAHEVASVKLSLFWTSVKGKHKRITFVFMYAKRIRSE